MKLWTDSFTDGAMIPGHLAFCVIAPGTHVALAQNRNPHLAWSDLPAGTQSLALICHDPDVPSKGDDVNQEGRTVPSDLPRVDFFHWCLVDIPPELTSIIEGEMSMSVTPCGKTGPTVSHSAFPGVMRHGINDYTGWFAADREMAGDYFGYDGPCPPWNDSIMHHYIFTLYALDLPRLPLAGKFGGAAVLNAIQGHILGQAQVTGQYSLNPDLVKP
ncbi:MAG: YbhB/YbcL family Raf kinase inhibitor-like protein [Burkholderiales bacterium]|nr:YbhB/YbcL family Raf kinase inhibitor-like protein [Burkholderiales bacterium]